MSNVGRAAAGLVYTAKGNSLPPSFQGIGTNSGLTANGVLIAEGNGVFQATSAGTAGQVLVSNGPGVNPSFQASSSSGAITTLTGNSGGAISPVAGNINTLATGSITIAGAGSTLTTQLTGLTNHAVLLGAGTATITNLGPTATAGQILQSAGAAADPAFSTATYPSTTTINQILYSSAANTLTGLATANSSFLTTNASGVPGFTALSTIGQTITGQTGGALSPSAGNWTINGNNNANNGFASYTTGSVSTLTVNSYGRSKWVVNPTAGLGTHTTIAAAISAAASGDVIFITSGTYTENITLIAGITLVGDAFGTPIINGTITASYSGTCALKNITLQTNSAVFLNMTGSNTCVLYLLDCFLNSSNNNGITMSNSNAGSAVIATNCLANVTATFNLFAVSAANTLRFENCPLVTGISGGTDSTVANTISAGSVEMRSCELNNPITVSSTGTLRISHSIINASGNNSTALTVNGSGTSVSQYNQFLGGTASCVSVGSGATLNSYHDTFDSTNTNAVTGAGTISYFEPVFSNSSSVINTTTQTGGTYKGVQTNTTVGTGFIGQVISSNVATPGSSISNGVATAITSLSVPAGNWMIFGLVGISSTGVISGLSAGVNLTTATFTTIGIDYSQDGTAHISASIFTLATPIQFISLSASTNYFLNAVTNITTGSATAFGKIQAVRIA